MKNFFTTTPHIKNILLILATIAITLTSFLFFTGTAFASDGTLDATFDSGSGFNGIVRVVEIQPDGKMLVGGQFTAYQGVVANRITRLNPDGSLDTTFNTGTGFDGTVYTTAIQSDGKILVGGQFTTYDGGLVSNITRLNSDGTLDTTFDTGLGLNNLVLSIAIQPDEKIILSGGFSSYNGILSRSITRLNPDGSFDTTFNIGTGFNHYVYSLALQPDGKILAGGSFSSFNGASRVRLARLNPDGSLDTTFNIGTGFNNIVRAIKIQPDAKILVSGLFTSFNGISTRVPRLNSDGSLDSTFTTPSFSGYIYDLGLDLNGRVFAGGSFTGANRNRILSLNPDGSLDTTFNIGTGFNHYVYGLALQQDGKIVVGGQFTSYNGTTTNRIARLAWATNITITPTTKLDNTSITDTTIQVTNDNGILASEVQVHTNNTAGYSNLNCTQTTTTQVDCTISIDTSGDLILTTTQGGYAIESNYIIDTVDPQTPSVSIDVTTNGENNPIVTFSSLDNVAIDYYEIDYVDSTGTPTTLTPATSPATLALDPNGLLILPFYHEITVRVYDTAGNSSESEVRFVPLVTFNTPTTISNTTINDASVTISTPSGNSLGLISLNDGGTGATFGDCTDGNNTLINLASVPLVQPVTCEILGVTSTGTITVSAVDFINTAVGKNNQSFIIETIPPTITVTAPTKTNNDIITNTTITITDDTAINANDITITATNTTGSFSLSNTICTQTTATRVDCTLQVDANTGTGDIQVNALDVAGNTNTVTETGYAIDVTPPAQPALPDLQATSDAGPSDTDNQTNLTSLTIDVICTELNSTIELFVDSVSTDTVACTALGTTPIPIALSDGVYALTTTETDSFNNTSVASPALTITIDTTITTTTLNSPTTGTPASGTAEPNSTVVITTPSGATCTTTADTAGNYSCTLTPTPVDGEDLTATATDDFGNISAATAPGGIDLTAPTTPIIDPVAEGDTTISGTGEDGSTITLTGITCDNDPIVVTGGVWECQNPQPTPRTGDTITATATDTAGNTSVGTYVLPSASTSHGGSVRYLCQDPSATNYDDSNFGRHKQSLCEYEYNAEINSNLTEGSVQTGNVSAENNTCPIFTQHLKKGDRDGSTGQAKQEVGVSTIIKEVKLLQQTLLEQGFNPGTIDGIYGIKTAQAVGQWQTKHYTQVLTPWNLTHATGFFYQSSERWMNELLGCDDVVTLDNGVTLTERYTG
ncbi:peptidoglycan-binding protein [Candidatus Nomurabacteria bacterium]|nr:peptidoglycan-binding protein [Candidatus Nomurabacteria bacterium]